MLSCCFCQVSSEVFFEYMRNVHALCCYALYFFYFLDALISSYFCLSIVFFGFLFPWMQIKGLRKFIPKESYAAFWDWSLGRGKH